MILPIKAYIISMSVRGESAMKETHLAWILSIWGYIPPLQLNVRTSLIWAWQEINESLCRRLCLERQTTWREKMSMTSQTDATPPPHASPPNQATLHPLPTPSHPTPSLSRSTTLKDTLRPPSCHVWPSAVNRPDTCELKAYDANRIKVMPHCVISQALIPCSPDASPPYRIYYTRTWGIGADTASVFERIYIEF